MSSALSESFAVNLQTLCKWCSFLTSGSGWSRALSYFKHSVFNPAALIDWLVHLFIRSFGRVCRNLILHFPEPKCSFLFFLFSSSLSFFFLFYVILFHFFHVFSFILVSFLVVSFYLHSFYLILLYFSSHISFLLFLTAHFPSFSTTKFVSGGSVSLSSILQVVDFSLANMVELILDVVS